MVLAAAGLALLVAMGVAVASGWPGTPSGTAAPLVSPPTTEAPQTAEPDRVVPVAPRPRLRRGEPGETSAPAASPGVPLEVTVPALGVAAPVLPIAAAGATLTPPSDPSTVGWWAAGAKAGEAQGSVLVTGHTVRAGGGAFDDLEGVDVGETVQVRTEAGSVAYRVTGVRVLDKAQLAAEASELFDPAGPPRLVLVTCEDWDGTSWLSNVVVVAVPATG